MESSLVSVEPHVFTNSLVTSVYYSPAEGSEIDAIPVGHVIHSFVFC